MADTKVSSMTAAATLDGSELYYVVQGGADRKATGTQVKTWALTAPIPKVYTVSTLPTPATGMLAYVSDGDAIIVWGSTVTNSGAGATPYLVWYNGTAWTVVGK